MESEWTSQLFWVLRIYVEYSLLWNQFLHQLQLTLLQISTIFRTSNSDSKKWKVTIDLILICFYLMTTSSKKRPKNCPDRSEYLSFIFQTQQLGITFRFPSPCPPCIHILYCLYAVRRRDLLKLYSLSSASISLWYPVATSNTSSSRTANWKSFKFKQKWVNYRQKNYLTTYY